MMEQNGVLNVDRTSSSPFGGLVLVFTVSSFVDLVHEPTNDLLRLWCLASERVISIVELGLTIMRALKTFGLVLHTSRRWSLALGVVKTTTLIVDGCLDRSIDAAIFQELVVLRNSQYRFCFTYQVIDLVNLVNYTTVLITILNSAILDLYDAHSTDHGGRVRHSLGVLRSETKGLLPISNNPLLLLSYFVFLVGEVFHLVLIFARVTRRFLWIGNISCVTRLLNNLSLREVTVLHLNVRLIWRSILSHSLSLRWVPDHNNAGEEESRYDEGADDYRDDLCHAKTIWAVFFFSLDDKASQ